MTFGLAVESQSLDIAGAWQHNRSIRRLMSNVKVRGENRIKPGVGGRTARTLMRDETITDLELMVFGINDSTGSAHSDVIAGLHENLWYLNDWALDTIASTTLTTVLTLTDSRTFETEAQILNWQVAKDDGTVATISYDLRIPSGWWWETTPS